MLRIRRTRWKVLFVVGAVALVFVANGLLLPRVLPDPIDVIAANALVLALYFGGTRSFRGEGEPIAPPRAWWRMTSKPKAGFIIGSLWIVSVASNLFSAITRPSDQLFDFLFNAVVDASVAFLYFRSSTLLRRNPPETVAEPIALPKWKPVRP